MNLVKKLYKHTIYYYCDNKIKYYINVPHKEFDTTNISLEFLEETSKFDPELNDIEWVKSNIIEYYEKVDSDNITLVMPILKDDEKEGLLSLNVNKLNIIEKLMALYINSSYIALTKNNINVNREVFLIENDKFINFIMYFKNKHNSRIRVKRLLEISDDIYNNDNNIDVNSGINEEIKPFAINENILNEALNNNKEIIDDNVDVESNIPLNNEVNNNLTNPILDVNTNVIVDDNINNGLNINPVINSESLDKEIIKTGNNNSATVLDINETQAIDNIIKTEENVSSVNPALVNEINELPIERHEEVKTDDSNTYSVLNTESLNNKNVDSNVNDFNNNIGNEKVDKEIKVTNIIKPNEEKQENIKNNEPINNIINISDLGSLTAGGLNGALPGNVTINIEKLVTENNNVKTKDTEDDVADEVSDLDEDISDIDEFDEDEDFDIDAIDVSEAVLSSDDGNKNYRTVISGGVKFVVGRKDDENLKPIEINKNNNNNNLDINNEKLSLEMPTNIVKGDDQINKNAGFASYFTLFFVAISAVFIIFYIIIK